MLVPSDIGFIGSQLSRERVLAESEWQCCLAGKVTVGLTADSGHVPHTPVFNYMLTGSRNGAEHCACTPLLIRHPLLFYLAPVGESRAVIRISVCLSVRPRAYLQNYTSTFTVHFCGCYLWPWLARSSSGGVVKCYLLLVLWMTSCLLIIARDR